MSGVWGLTGRMMSVSTTICGNVNSSPIRMTPTPEGVPTIEWQRADGRWIPLHSRHRPREEARRWVAGLDWTERCHIVLLGLGLGYHLAEVLRSAPAWLKRVIVIESNAEMAAVAMDRNPAGIAWTDPRLERLIAPTPDELYRVLSCRMVHLLVEGYAFYELPFVGPRELAIDREYWEVLQQIESEIENSKRHIREQGAAIQEHLLKNWPYLATSGRLSALRNYALGLPAFVVGAGPSLDRNISALACAGPKGLVIAVDTIVPRLQRESIPVQVVVAKDAQRANLRHLQAIPEPRALTLAFDPQLDPEGVALPFAARLLIPNRCRRIFEHLPSTGLREEDGLPLGQTSVHAAFSLAVHLGCHPIVLAGTDFAFPREGGPSHAAGTALRTQVEIADTMHYQGDPARGLVDAPAEPIMWVHGYDGRRVPTSVGFAEALRRFELLVASCSAQVINATEGGACIAGTQQQCLTEIIAMFPNKSPLTARRFAEYVNQSACQVIGDWRQDRVEAYHFLKQSWCKARDLLERMNQNLVNWDEVRAWRREVVSRGGSAGLLEACLEYDEIGALRADLGIASQTCALEYYRLYLQAFVRGGETALVILET